MNETILASHRFQWRYDQGYKLELQANGSKIEAYVEGKQIFAVVIRRINAGRRRGRPCGRHRIDATQAVHITPL